MCDLYFEDPIFYVEYVSKFNKSKNMIYIFVGVVEDNIEIILKKLENSRETVKSDELNLLKNKYKNDFPYWKELRTSKKAFKFINSHIMYDDSLNEFKRKIFVYCSTDSGEEHYLLPQNMELWVVDNENKSHMLGYKYKDMMPHINEPVELGKEYVYNMYTNEVGNVEKNNNKRIIESSDNYTLLYDLLKNIKLKNNLHKLYLSDAFDEYKELIKSPEYSKADKNELKTKYLKNYFPVAVYDMDLQKMKSTYLLAKDDSTYNDFIVDNLFHYPIDKSLFESCYFNNFVLNVNNLEHIKSDELNMFSGGNKFNGGAIKVKLNKNMSKSKNQNQKVNLINNINNNISKSNNKNNNSKSIITNETSLVKKVETSDYDFIDLYQIFEYLRAKKIGKKTPFIKYNDVGFSNPFILISKAAVDENLVNKQILLSQWSDPYSQGKKFNGLQVKRYIKDLVSKNSNEKTPLFSTLQIHKYGRIHMSVAFKSEHKARFNEINDCINNCGEFIDDINKNIIDYRISRSIDVNKKIVKPTSTLDKNSGIILSPNCTIAYINYFIEYKNGTNIDLKDLYEFCKLFPSFISLNPNKKAGLNSIQIRYNRVSGFANLDEIMEEIYNLKEKNIKDGLIIKFLEKKFGKSTEECKKYLLEYKKKYSHIQSSSEDSKNKLGFVIQITKNNITVRGVRNMRHIYDTYRFLCLFMSLYLNKDILKSNAKFKRLLFSRDPNASENAALQFQGLTEVKQDFTFENLDLDLNIGDQATIDVGITEILNQRVEDEENESNVVSSVGSINSATESFQLKVGNTILAGNDEISTDVQLSCDDAIPEIDTCEDFCNDAKYFIRQLQRHDNKLFYDKREKLKGRVKYEKYTKYSKSCQKIRQPVVLSYNPEDGLSVDTHMEIKRDSYSYAIKYGSNPEKPNWYICPEVWCPRCRIPIPMKDIDSESIRKRKTAGSGGTCIIGVCPYSETGKPHQVFIRGNKDPYPGFQDTKTEDGFCLPCCFGKRQDDPKYSSYKTFQKCLGIDVNEGNEEENIIYVLGKAIPLDKNRFGILNPRMEKVLNSNIPTGYLAYQKGFLRRGIKHENHNSFLSAIANIFSCDQENVRSVDDIKEYIVNKIDEKLFRSLYGGNLINVFYDPHKDITPLQNYKNYILSKNIDIDHTYLWDLIQRPRIISEYGLNLFIFEDNMLCPVGEHVTEFYDKEKKTIILAKYKQYYEPIYYLEGNGKQALIQCVFDNNSKEIQKLFEIAYDGCKPYNKIDWKAVVFNSLMKPNIVFNSLMKPNMNKEHIVIDYGISLKETLKDLLTAIKINKKLDKSYMPKRQYLDNSNKVIGLLLENGLFIPVAPSKLIVDIDKLDYTIIEDYKDIPLLNIDKTILYMQEISKLTKIPIKPVGYISDSKNEYIVGIVTEKERIICVEKTKNNEKVKGLKHMDKKFYSDIDMFIHNNIKLVDERIIFMNKRKYEDETYTRIRFEIARYLQENIDFRNKIYKIINGNEKDINKRRNEISNIITPIFNKLISTKQNNIDYDFYEKPNQRMPCRMRSINKSKNKSKESNNSNKNSEIIFSCDEDPHCVAENNNCKLHMNEYNLLDTHKQNVNIYLPMLIEEIVRFLLKRTEILEDHVPSIINREHIIENPNKYYIIHTTDSLEIVKKIDGIFLDKEGLYLDKRPLFDTITTSEYVLPQGKYALVNSSKLLNNMNEIPEIWSKLLGYNFILILHHSGTKVLFNIFDLLINELKNKNNSNYMNNMNSLDIRKVKEMMINFMENPVNKLLIKKIISKIKNNLESTFNSNNNSSNNNSSNNNSNKSKNNSNSLNSKSENQKDYMVEIYKKLEPKVFRNVNDFASLKHKILSDEYEGNDLDIGMLSHIFKINFLILNKKRKDSSNKALLYGNEATDFYTDYVMLLRNNNIDNFKYQWFQLKNKGLIHKMKDYSEKFIREVIEKI